MGRGPAACERGAEEVGGIVKKLILIGVLLLSGCVGPYRTGMRDCLMRDEWGCPYCGYRENSEEAVEKHIDEHH